MRLENQKPRFTIGRLLRPYTKSLAIVVMAVIGAGVANLLQPWPLKIVFDMVGGSKPVHGWLKHFVHAELGPHKMATLEFAALAVIAHRCTRRPLLLC